MNNPAQTDLPIAEIVRQRWSPRAFSSQPIRDGDLKTLFEAARWAPSCYNAQPWHFIFAKREAAEEFSQMLDCLVPGNQTWAKNAAVLLISVAKETFDHNNKPNAYARYDTGQAVAAITLQAVELGIRSHQMAGFDPEKARQTYAIPEGYAPVTAIALGYDGALDSLPEKLQKMEQAKRQRRSQDEFVFRGDWGQR